MAASHQRTPYSRMAELSFAWEMQSVVWRSPRSLDLDDVGIAAGEQCVCSISDCMLFLCAANRPVCLSLSAV